MAKGLFSAEEYKKMWQAWIDYINEGGLCDNADEAYHGKFIGVDYEADNGLYVTCEAQYDHEISSSAPFDRPYDETCDVIFIDVVDLKNIVVYDNTVKEAKVVEGAFDYDAFFEANKD